jgi:uracil-DNA glycosylase
LRLTSNGNKIDNIFGCKCKKLTTKNVMSSTQFNEKKGKLSEATEKYICCIACCTEKNINPKKEPNLSKLWDDLPYANAYAKHKQTGVKWKPGSVEFFTEPGKPNVIVIFARMYSGQNGLPGDDSIKRRSWFHKALETLTTYSDLTSLAFNKGVGYLDGNNSRKEYNDLIEDFSKIYRLRNGRAIDISLYVNDEQVKPQKKGFSFKKKSTTLKSSLSEVETIKRLGLNNGPTISDISFYENDFYRFKLKESAEATEASEASTEAETEAEAEAEAKATEETSIEAEASTEAEASIGSILRSIPFDQSWRWLLLDPKASKYLSNVEDKLSTVLLEDDTFPVKEEIFNAFNCCPFNKLKVVIIGQDPYPTRGNAHGLSFSVKPGVKIPRSLSVIYNAIVNDEEVTDFVKPKHGSLLKWSEQGVLLLNTALTVKEGSKNCGCHVPIWSKFTDRIIELISEKTTGVAFVLWGGKAKAKSKLVNKSKHMVFEYHHPTARNNNTFATKCKHFSEINRYLKTKGKKEVDWQI